MHLTKLHEQVTTSALDNMTLGVKLIRKGHVAVGFHSNHAAAHLTP